MLCADQSPLHWWKLLICRCSYRKGLMIWALNFHKEKKEAEHDTLLQICGVQCVAVVMFDGCVGTYVTGLD